VIPVPVFELNNTLPPAQKVKLPPAVIVAVGKALTVTTLAAEVAEHPLELVLVTVYEPAVVAVYVDAVAPAIVTPFFFQTYVIPALVFELSTTLPPVHKLKLPPAVIIAVGKALTVTTLAVEVAEHPLELVLVTV
jgi:hypothetical protein